MGAHESLRAMSASKAAEEIKSAPKSSRATGKTKKVKLEVKLEDVEML
jgi:hypothetical protein